MSPPARPPSFQVRLPLRLRPGPNRWSIAFSAALCTIGPVTVGWLMGDTSAGMVASIGSFTALYGSDRPYRNRAVVLLATAFGLAGAIALGTLVHSLGHSGLGTVVLMAMLATFFCNAVRIGPPGAYIFALVGAIGTGLTAHHLEWWQVGLLVLGGGLFSMIVRMAGALTDLRGPERATVIFAGMSVARFLKSGGGPGEDAARHAAAVALHETWTNLVTRQGARAAGDSALIGLRAISRDLHLLFIDGINAGHRTADREQLAARAHELIAEARAKTIASQRQAPEHLPLGRIGFGETLKESLQWPSPILVVSLRVGVAAALAGVVGAALGLERVYWIVATAILVLHQGWDWGRSLQRGLEQVVGTLLGLALAGAMLWLAPQGLWLALILAASQFVIQLLVVRNYALAVVIITGLAVTMVSGGHAVADVSGLLWDRAIDTVIGCAVGIGVLLVTTPRAVAVPIPQDIVATLGAARELLTFVAAGDAVSAEAKRARRNLQFRTIALPMAYEFGTGARGPNRRFAEELWPAVVAAQRLAYRLLAFCWSLEEAGREASIGKARAAFGDNGLESLRQALRELSDATRSGHSVTIRPDVPDFLKDDLEDLARSMLRGSEAAEAAGGQPQTTGG